MPLVRIDYMPDSLSDYHLQRLKRNIRKCGAIVFGTENHRLQEKDFSLIFNEVSVESELTHEVIITIYLHASYERLAKDPDKLAASLANVLADGSMKPAVMLVFAQIGWAVGEVNTW